MSKAVVPITVNRCTHSLSEAFSSRTIYHYIIPAAVQRWHWHSTFSFETHFLPEIFFSALWSWDFDRDDSRHAIVAYVQIYVQNPKK